MRQIIGLLAFVIGLALCTSARAQDPMSYDPAYYDYYDYSSPVNPNYQYYRRLRQLRAQKAHPPGMLARMQTFTSNMTTGVSSGVYRVVSFLSAANDPNNSLPKISTGPGSPLQQPGSLTGTAADAQMGTPPAQSLFGAPTANNFSLFGRPNGPPTASGSVLGKQP